MSMMTELRKLVRWREISDLSLLAKFGQNGAVGTTQEDVWDAGASYGGWVAAKETLYIMSSDNGDTQDYTVYGLDENWAEQSETVTATGQTPKVLANQYLRVNRVVNVGSTTCAGDVYISNDNTNVTDGVPDTAGDVRAKVQAGKNQTLMAVWSVPAGKTLNLTSLSLSEASNKGVTFEFYVRPFGQVFQVKRTFELFGGAHIEPFHIPYEIAAKSDVVMRAKAVAASAIVSAAFSGWYE